MLKPISILAVLISAFIWSGCSYKLKLTKFQIPPDAVESFQGDTPVKIFASNIADNIKRVGSYAEPQSEEAFPYFVDFNEVNNIAVDLIKNELQKNGIPMSDNAQKVVKFTTTKI